MRISSGIIGRRGCIRGHLTASKITRNKIVLLQPKSQISQSLRTDHKIDIILVHNLFDAFQYQYNELKQPFLAQTQDTINVRRPSSIIHHGHHEKVCSEVTKRVPDMQVSGHYFLDLLKIGKDCQPAAELNPIRIRHAKCDEAQPRCQCCVSTGRKCDGYCRESGSESPASLSPYGLASRSRAISPSENIQERRSFDLFRNETVPNIAGFFGTPTWNLVLQACNREPAISQAVITLGALHERCSASLVANSDDTRLIETSFPIRQYAKALGVLRRYMSTASGLDFDIILLSALIHILSKPFRTITSTLSCIWKILCIFCKLLAQKSKNQPKANRTLFQFSVMIASTRVLVVHSYVWT